MIKTIKARYSGGMIRPLEKLDIEEGKELTVTIFEVPEKPEGEDPLELTFGGWLGLVDAEQLKKNIYADRLVVTRPRVKL